MCGLQDEIKLIDIKEFANSIQNYDFLIDDRNRATSIFIDDYGNFQSGCYNEEEYHTLRERGFRHWVPDLLDLRNKVIIEYQESAKKTGKHTVKGHDELNDADKDLYYQLAGFIQIKVWDYDEQWKPNLRSALTMITKKKRISE